MRLPLSKDNFTTTISVYASTMTNPAENKEVIYNQLASVLSGTPRTDKLLLIGDFNARIGRDSDKWPLVIGKYEIGKCNSNGELLPALCSEFELIVSNTMFKQKDERKNTWMHPRSKHRHMIDFIMRCRDEMDIHSTRAMRGANCCTDHQMLRSKVAFRIRQKHNRQGTNKPTKLNTAKLGTISRRESFEQEMDSALAQSMGGEGKLNIRRGMGSSAAGSVQHSQDISWLARQKTPGLVRPQRPGVTDSDEQKRPSPP